MPLDVIGDEIVLDGQIVGKLLGRAAETTTLNERVREMLNGERDDGDDDDFWEEPSISDFSDAEILAEARERGLLKRRRPA